MLAKLPTSPAPSTTSVSNASRDARSCGRHCVASSSATVAISNDQRTSSQRPLRVSNNASSRNSSPPSFSAAAAAS